MGGDPNDTKLKAISGIIDDFRLSELDVFAESENIQYI